MILSTEDDELELSLKQDDNTSFTTDLVCYDLESVDLIYVSVGHNGEGI